jgi:endonuclease YncB( thermonuclease family)
MKRPRPTLLALALAAAPLAALTQTDEPPRSGTAQPESTQPGTTRTAPVPPAELFEVLRVVDGDTIHVRRAGRKEKLRLLSVDTEEKISGREFIPSKPETIYGQETTVWARELFEGRAGEDGKTRVGLRFPGGAERRDVYGRLLCHVILDDGRDFNLLLVRSGRSPYFNKYGNSEICHDEFVEAQTAARAAGIGVWDPETNRSKDPDTPSITRPYDRLLPWWQARAEAIDAYRAAHGEDPLRALHAEEPEALERASKELGKRDEVRVFGSIDRIFEEGRGELTLLFRATDRERAVRVALSRRAASELEAMDLENLGDSYRQNYLWVRGRLEVNKSRGGWEIEVDDADQVTLAGPEPDEVVVPGEPRGEDGEPRGDEAAEPAEAAAPAGA